MNLNIVSGMHRIFKNFHDEKLVHVFLLTSGLFTFSTNSNILRHVIKFHTAAERFDSFFS